MEDEKSGRLDMCAFRTSCEPRSRRKDPLHAIIQFLGLQNCGYIYRAHMAFERIECSIYLWDFGRWIWKVAEDGHGMTVRMYLERRQEWIELANFPIPYNDIRLSCVDFIQREGDEPCDLKRSLSACSISGFSAASLRASRSSKSLLLNVRNDERVICVLDSAPWR